ncbi:formylglycine-generating enzyme family protein [Bradyrhizobium sp. HKCCYLS2038]|uniref:formylglycine-generating enzyme family protein n=1 Tax=unclassified Bradyrhizobium TaxID=2631580 RepID=UPI003EC14487
MSELSSLQWLRAPKLAEDTLPAETLRVDCRRCGRSVQVSLSAMRPPSFLHVDDQVECPEVQERWSGRGESGLLMMMCGALEQSLDPVEENEDHEAVARHEPAQFVEMPPSRIATPRVDPPPQRWDEFVDDGYLEEDRREAERRGWLPSLLAWSAPHRRAVVRIAVGTLVLSIVAVGGVLLPLRNLQLLIQSPPGFAGASTMQRDALPTAISVRRITMETPSAAATPQEAPLGVRAPSPLPAAMRQAPAAETSPAPAPQPVAASVPEPVSTPEPKLRLPEMIAITGGTFAMGGEDESEQPVHQVSIRPFAIGKYPVTVGEWKPCVAAGGCADIAVGADDRPVTNASYDDAQAYLAWLSKVSGKTFRLPTEAEWEFAARAGQRSKYWWGDRMRVGMANCKGCNNSGDATDAAQPLKVGSFAANPLGLFDMGGAVGQWVADNWHKNYKGAPSDGSAWLEDGSYARVIRSGSWSNGPSDARAGSRDRYDGRIRHPTLGFRVALTP